jgi:hypothetical protein
MSFVLGYVVNEAVFFMLNDALILLVEELEGCLEWTLKFQGSRGLGWRLYLVQSKIADYYYS